jgi:hypothetical protein
MTKVMQELEKEILIAAQMLQNLRTDWTLTDANNFHAQAVLSQKIAFQAVKLETLRRFAEKMKEMGEV